MIPTAVAVSQQVMGFGTISFLHLYFLLWAKNRLLTMENRSINHKLTFPEIQTLVHQNQLAQLGRNPQQENLYQRRKKERENLWESLSDCILHDKFKLDYVISPSGKRIIPRPLPEWTNGLIRTVPNDFPYNFHDDVVHLVLWKIGDQVYENDVKSALHELKKTYLFNESCYFINPPHLKSILDVDHAHLILHINQSKSLLSSRMKKGLIYGIGGLSLLVTAKFFHTAFLFHSFVNELMELNKPPFSIHKLFKFSLKYIIPFPFNFILNQIIRRITIASSTSSSV
jgi:hypothetical protein